MLRCTGAPVCWDGDPGAGAGTGTGTQSPVTINRCSAFLKLRVWVVRVRCQGTVVLQNQTNWRREYIRQVGSASHSKFCKTIEM